MASISKVVIICLREFHELIAQAKELPQAAVDDLGLIPAVWEDELGRLRLWVTNIGAHQSNQASLDFRLRDSSHIRDQILRLLHDLQERFQNVRDIVAEDSDSSGDSSDSDESTTAVQDLRESVASIIDCLFQMSMLIRKPARPDLVLGSTRAEVKAFEPFDYNHVHEKHPKADDAIVERLGLALTRRRRYLKYRERHALKLRKGIQEVIPGANEGETKAEGTVSLLSDTIATSAQLSSIHFDDGSSESGMSQTSYAQTLLGDGAITIPRPPKSSLGGRPFECPYCHLIITTKSVRAWHKHVFLDLQPYSCVVPKCTTPDKLYSTRHEWLHHVDTAHPISEDTGGLGAIATPDSHICPLCEEEIASGKRTYARHVARHLQELALFILPRSGDDSDDSDLEEDGSNAAINARPMSEIDLSSSEDEDSISEEPIKTNNSTQFLRVMRERKSHYKYIRAKGRRPPNNSDLEEDGSNAAINARPMSEIDLSSSEDEDSISEEPIKIIDSVQLAHMYPFAGEGEAEWEELTHRPPPPPDAKEVALETFAGRTGIDPAMSGDQILSIDGEDDEISIIKCICGFIHVDDSFVRCTDCNTRQHYACYYPDEARDRIMRFEAISMRPHFCVDCRSRPIDVEAAIHRQRQRAALKQSKTGIEE